MRSIFILGAGASAGAGLPLAGNFTRAMLSKSGLKPDGPSSILIDYLTQFVSDVFGNGENITKDEWPSLEDLFTTIDLAANSGHNLGSKHSASDLRTARRAFLLRMMRMLQISFNARRREGGAEWDKLAKLYRHVEFDTSTFLTMNWDTVVEDFLWREQGIRNFDYRCREMSVKFDRKTKQIVQSVRSKGIKTATILKPHGSINWMYCDNCRQLFWFRPGVANQIASRLFKDSDKACVDRTLGKYPNIRTSESTCPVCETSPLSTRFATFSFKKALDFPMYGSTWRAAERRLRKAKHWVFFGYSMPSADYEFKHMLKTCYLGRKTPPEILLITGGQASSDTIDTFRRFFGNSALPDENVFLDGLDDRALVTLSQKRILRNAGG